MSFKINLLLLSAIVFIFADSESQPATNTTEFIADDPICEMFTGSPHCVKLGKKLYIINQNKELNWFQADRDCRQQNSHLAIIRNDAEMNAIAAYADKYLKFGANKYWLGATDLGSEGIFHEIESGGVLPYTRWGQGLPDNYRGEESCLNLMAWTEKKFVMNDDNCTFITRFICEIRLGNCENLYNNQIVLNRALKGNLHVTLNNPTIYITNNNDEQ